MHSDLLFAEFTDASASGLVTSINCIEWQLLVCQPTSYAWYSDRPHQGTTPKVPRLRALELRLQMGESEGPEGTRAYSGAKKELHAIIAGTRMRSHKQRWMHFTKTTSLSAKMYRSSARNPCGPFGRIYRLQGCGNHSAVFGSYISPSSCSTHPSVSLSYLVSILQHLSRGRMVSLNQFSFSASYTDISLALSHLATTLIPHQYSLMRESPYIGKPSPTIEKAWTELFSPMALRVTTADLIQHQQSSVPLPKGGFLAWLGVYHELHCVKVLRQANYRDHYHPNITQQELRDLQVHADHCVDLLREALMCHGDTETLTTFVWREGWGKPLLSPERPIRKCLDWTALVESLKAQIVESAEMDALENIAQHQL